MDGEEGKMNRIALLTSALNEAAVLAELSRAIPADYDCYLVDDGSIDSTAEVAERLGFRVIRHSVNLGQGFAFITGIKAILADQTTEYDYIAYIDADGQHDPLEIPRFILKAEDEGLDVVAGSRVLGSNHKGAPLIRRAFLPLFTLLINKLSGYELSDPLCGFRAFRVSTLRRILPVFDQMIEPRYLAAEMFIRFARAGVKVGDVPVRLRTRRKGKSRKGTIRFGYGILRAIINTISDKNYRASIKDQGKPENAG